MKKVYRYIMLLSILLLGLTNTWFENSYAAFLDELFARTSIFTGVFVITLLVFAITLLFFFLIKAFNENNAKISIYFRIIQLVLLIALELLYFLFHPLALSWTRFSHAGMYLIMSLIIVPLIAPASLGFLCYSIYTKFKKKN